MKTRIHTISIKWLLLTLITATLSLGHARAATDSSEIFSMSVVTVKGDTLELRHGSYLVISTSEGVIKGKINKIESDKFLIVNKQQGTIQDVAFGEIYTITVKRGESSDIVRGMLYTVGTLVGVTGVPVAFIGFGYSGFTVGGLIGIAVLVAVPIICFRAAKKLKGKKVLFNKGQAIVAQQ